MVNEKKTSRAKPPPRGSGARTHGTHHADAPSPPALANHASHENTNSANTRQPHTHAPGRRHARAHAAEAAAMPMPSACRISEAAAICVATEMRCITNGMNLRVDHVASASNSPCVSLLPRASAASLILPCRVAHPYKRAALRHRRARRRAQARGPLES